MNDKQLTRRGLLTAAGAAAGGAAALGVGGWSAAAAATPSGTSSAQPQSAPGAHPATAPALPTPIASAPVAGVSYRFLPWHEFAPENNTTSGRAFGGFGAFTGVAADFLAAFTDIAPGARIYDVEYYLRNSSAVTLYGITWVAGVGPYPSPYWLQQNHPANAAMHAARFLVPSSVNGPFPHGTKIGVSLSTPTDASVQIDGVRIGFVGGPASTMLLPGPVRVYNSLTHDGPLSSGHSRTIDLSGHLPVGAIGAIVNVQVTRTVGSGYLTLYPAGTPRPGTSTITWFGSGQSLSNQATTALGSGRRFSVYAGGGHSTQYLVDLLAYLV